MNISKRRYKLVVIFLILCVLLSLAGCKKDVDYGEIKEVDVTEPIDSEAENVFTPLDDNLGYSYKTVRHPRACMSFEVPNGWDIVFKNGRHIEITAPDNDPQLPGVTIHLLSCYTLDGEFHDTVGSYSEIFDEELSGLYFNIDGKKFRRTGYRPPAVQDTDASFTERKDMVSLAEFDNLSMVNSTGMLCESPCAGFAYYVKWAQYPTVFSSVCKDELKPVLKRLLSYMVSSIQHQSQKITASRTITYDGLIFSVPKGFQNKKDAENIFLCDYETSSVCSGMGVGVFKTQDSVDAQSIMFTYADKIALSFLPNQTYHNVYSCLPVIDSIKVAGKSAERFTASCTIMPKKASAGDFYLSGQTWYLTIYALPYDGKEQSLIAIWSQDSQGTELETVQRLIEQHTTVK